VVGEIEALISSISPVPPEKLILHGKLAEPAQGGIQLRCNRIAASFFECGLDPLESFSMPLLQAIGFDTQLARESVDRFTAE
jgi:hypothetical protein